MVAAFSIPPTGSFFYHTDVRFNIFYIKFRKKHIAFIIFAKNEFRHEKHKIIRYFAYCIL